MQVVHEPGELRTRGQKVCAAIGFFDGIHLGHREILNRTMADARAMEGVALAVTFDRHPYVVVAPDRVPPLIYSLPQKLRVLEALGLDATLLIHFDRAFSEQSGETFIRGLAQGFGPLHSLSVGANFTFGHKRSGDVALLRKLGLELGFAVRGVEAVLFEGETISSTRVRESIRAGRLEDASRLLGRPYSFASRVVTGDRLGRRMGIPTANLDPDGLALPPTGVYAVEALWRGQVHPAVLNIGFRPTLGQSNPPLRVEAHLLDFSTDLHGEELEIVLRARLRDEIKFGSVEELRAQISKDIEQARQEL